MTCSGEIMKAHKLLITDIGSTNTKGIILTREDDSYLLRAIARVGTTVEFPHADVKAGLYRVVRKLEEISGLQLLDPVSEEHDIRFCNDVAYLTTSSAGGGLQILVIGLALNESASSAERAANGAGGVILETIAVDDKRLPVERIQLIDLLRPDIILFSGGIDGGAYASVIRMGELLRAANPEPKFGVSTSIPLIYAGNKAARDFIKIMFEEKYDLHLIDNIRPRMDEENLEPARNEIHRLFMENVMEQAPGYSGLKQLVMDDIIPTPAGVIKSLEIISAQKQKHSIAVDIGGATTDIFTNIFGHYYRTVSANYGMSYSIANVMADAGFDRIRRWLPSEMDDNYIRNYIVNKMLYPTFIPEDESQQAIEHAAAREAIRMSKEHHLHMNFQLQQKGFLVSMIEGGRSRFRREKYTAEQFNSEHFTLQDLEIVIGAGGIFSGTRNEKQVISLLSDALDIAGVTELWHDIDFISPHLGKLSDLEPELAGTLLLQYGYRKLAVTVKPDFKEGKRPKKLLTLQIKDNRGEDSLDVWSDSLFFLEPEEETEYVIRCLKGCSLGLKDNPITIRSKVPLLIDTRHNNRYDFDLANETLGLYNLAGSGRDLSQSFSNLMDDKQIKVGRSTIRRSLPYEGELFIKAGERVNASTLLGETKFEPPILFIISIVTLLNIDPGLFREGIEIKEGDIIKPGQRIFHLAPRGMLGSNRDYHAITGGVVEKINYDSGSIHLREIQDYPLKPLKLKVAGKLGIPPKELKGVLKKRKDDFVRTGETIAKNIYRKDKGNLSVKIPLYTSPTTGTIIDIDYEEGTITLQYLKKGIKLFSGVSGTVSKTDKNREVTVEYTGMTINGIIGFGPESYGTLTYLASSSSDQLSSCRGKIVVSSSPVGLSFLREAEKNEIKGLIIPSINDSELVKYTGKEIGVALTGKEPIPYSIILTEGCGNFPMNQKIAQILKESEGKVIYLDTFTQIRAGVKRPQIIISQ